MIMRSLFNFLVLEEAPKSDSAIYYRIGKNKFNWSARGGNKERIRNKYGSGRSGIIKYARDVMPDLLPNEKEIVHRKDWDLEGLIGETEKQLLHPSYWNVNEYILKNHKRKHDVLTIFECSNSKPYSSARTMARYLSRFAGVSDFANISNPGIIPVEFSHFYPYRYDEWDHFAEKEDIADKYCKVNIGRLLKYKKELGYKHVLILMQHPAPQKALDIMDKENIENCNSWLHIISNKNFHNQIKNRYYSKFGNEGLLITRTMGMPYTMDTYVRTLSKYVEGKEKETLEDVKKLMKEYEKSSLSKHLQEYNEEHDIQTTFVEDGAKESWSMLSPNDTKQELVSKFGSYLKKWLDDFDVDSDKDLHKNRVYFTVLDALQDCLNNPDYIEDPDVQYWSMKKALDDYAKKNNDLQNTLEYVYYKKSIADKLKLKESDIIKDSDKLGITQSDDDRIKHTNKNN